MPFEWNQVGTSFSVMWLYNYKSGSLFPPDEAEVKGKSFAEVTDIGVKRIHDANGGLGIPYSFLMWHWGMVCVFLGLYSTVFYLTTPIGDEFPWLTFVQKLIVWFYMWESVGLGNINGPLSGKMSPPWTDWWYRLTPGTLKYNAPFMSCLPYKRNYLDVFVEGILTYVFVWRVLLAHEVTPHLMWPLTACAIYEFFFDHGQHLHTYGTQNLHCFVAMCFPVHQGQVVGIQLFLIWFYACSGWCKIGPCFKFLNISNLMTAKFMVGMPWSHWFRRTMFKAYDAASPDYNFTTCARVVSTMMSVCETLGPLLCLSKDWRVVWTGIAIFVAMHMFIIATLIVDVFCWNAADAVWFVVLFGIMHTGLDWHSIPHMHPLLVAWLCAHAAYSVYGNFVPSHVNYIVAHRHAAGNWCWGVMLLKKSAAGKLGLLKAHAGLPQNAPGWQGEWFGFHCLWAYAWNWNMPTRMLMPLVIDTLAGRDPEEFVMIHSGLFFDALVAHLRFDGLSSLQLLPEVGKICGFEEGECVLAWVGAFQSFPINLFFTLTAKWKVLDSKTGLIKEGIFDAQSCEHPEYRKPSDCTRFLPMFNQAEGYRPCP